MQVIQKTKRWTSEEDDFIKNNYNKMTDREIGDHLNRNWNSVKNERLKLGLKRENRNGSTIIKNIVKNREPTPTYDELKQMFDDRCFDLVSDCSEYKNKSFKLSYICRKHSDHGIQKIDIYHFKRGQGCYYCGRERTEKAHMSMYSLEEDKMLCELKCFEYVKTEHGKGVYLINFICPAHRILGIQKMRRSNMNRKSVSGCQYCNGRNFPHWYIKQEIEVQYPNLSVVSEYLGMNKPLTCLCNTHGITFTNKAKEIFYKGSGCSQCASERKSSWQRLTTEEIRQRVKEINDDFELIDDSEYTGYQSKLKIQCSKCGHTWNASLYDLRNQQGHCPKCYIRLSTSSGEMAIIQHLSECRINYIPQYQIDDCKNIRTLPFDIGIVSDEMNLLGLIEYQGEQHYKPIEWWGGYEKYVERIKNDKIKNDYCENKNIPLLIIPYWEYDEINQILDNYIEKIS